MINYDKLVGMYLVAQVTKTKNHRRRNLSPIFVCIVARRATLSTHYAVGIIFIDANFKIGLGRFHDLSVEK